MRSVALIGAAVILGVLASMLCVTVSLAARTALIRPYGDLLGSGLGEWQAMEETLARTRHTPQ
jgi:hypothetical protein